MYRNSQAPAKESKYKFENGRMIERYPQQAPKQRGKGGTLSSMISEAGGLTGAILGLPFGPAGVAIGAGLGSAGGRLVENKFRDNRVDAQSFKQAAGEGLLSGVLSAGPIKLLKGGYGAAKAIGTGAKIGPAFSQAATKSLLTKTPIAKQAIKTGFMAESRAGGYGVGEKLAGQKALRQSGSEAIHDTLKFHQIKAGHPVTMATDIETKLGTLGKGLESALKSSNRLLTSKEKTALLTNYRNAIGKDATITGASRKTANEYVKNLNKTLNTVEDVITQRRNFQNELINWYRNPQGAVPGGERVARLARTTMNDFINNASPSLRKANSQWSKLARAEDYVVQQAGRVSAASRNIGGGPLGRAMGGDTAQTIKAKGGALLQKIGADRKLVSGKVGLGARVGLGSTIANLGQPQDQTQMDQSQEQDMQGQDIYGGQDMGGMLGSQGYETSQTQQSAYPLEQALRDLNSTTNPKFQQQIQDRYEFVQKAEASQAGGPQKYNSTAAGVIADTTTGLQALQDLRGSIASSKINAPIIGQLRGMNPYDTKAQNLQSQIGIVKQIVGKALEGGVLRKEDEIKYAKILPKLGDSQAVAQNKINQLYGLITQRLSLYKQSISGDGGTDLSSVIQGYGAQ